MRKFLKSKDILLLGLAGLLDAFEEIKDPFSLMSSSYKNMYGWVPNKYRRHNFHQLISRSLKTDLIARVEKKGEVYIRITSNGRKAVRRDFPILSLQNREWDGNWRIVMFDVDEVNKRVRNKLRRKLKELGFGMLQKSVFISPHDLLKDFSEFAESSGVKNYLYILETHKLIVADQRQLANRVWKLDDLNEKYRDIVMQIDKIKIDKTKNSHLISIDDRSKKSDSQMKEMEEKARNKHNDTLVNIRNNWLGIAAEDPFLPKAFLPIPWYREKAQKLVKGLILAYAVK